MINIANVLKSNALFKGIAPCNISSLLAKINYTAQTFKKDSLIFSEGEICSSMGFVLKGQVNVHKPSISGSTIIVNTLKPGDSFGDAYIFADKRGLHSAISTSKESEILFISSAEILTLCENDSIFMRNLIKGLSNRILFLHGKVKMLSHRSIRQRLSSYLIDESSKKKSLSFRLRHKRSEIADMIGTTRPSVSRELSNMAASGIIKINNRDICILDYPFLENITS